MTLTQTYRLAHRARGKLSSEASRGDHDLRLLVGHANLLDTLMVELHDAEREQDAWFEQSVAGAPKPSEPKRVAFAPSIEQHRLDIPDASEDEAEDNESDSEDEDSRKPVYTPTPAARLYARSPPATRVSFESDDDEEAMADSDDESDNIELALTRTTSRSSNEQVPDLVHESDSSDESDEETPSPSPTNLAADLAAQYVIVKDFAAATQSKRQQQRQEMQAMEVSMADDDIYLPSTPSAPMCKVY